MNKRDKSAVRLALLAASLDQTVNEMIADMFEQEHSILQVSFKLSVAPNSVRYRLLAHGYKYVNGQWFRPDAIQEAVHA
jgi:arginine decarboxylase-like protein